MPPVVGAWVSLIIVLLATGLMLAGVMLYLMARLLLRPERMTDAKATMVLKRLSPGDLGLDFEDIPLDIRDEQTGGPMRVGAWWIPSGTSNQTILLIHGRGDAKVGAIAWAPTLHSLGWNILAIDLRAHGDSGGVFSTAGFWERHDVAQVINQFRAARPVETKVFVIFGVSLGAAVAVATTVGRSDIDALILESPFGDYRQAIAAHGFMQGYPGGPLREVAVRLAEWMSASNFNAVRPQDLLRQVSCPVMVIASGADPFIPPADAIALRESVESRQNAKDIHWMVPDTGHVLGLAAAGPEEYRRRVAEFLSSVAR